MRGIRLVNAPITLAGRQEFRFFFNCGTGRTVLRWLRQGCRLETATQLCLSKVSPALKGDLVVLAAKGNTLRTALWKKADIVPSPAGISVNDAVSRAIKTVLASLEDSKAENIVSIDIQGKSSLGDYMVIASGRSHRHVSAVADHLLKALKDAGLGTARVEGLAGADWVLIDSGDIIVHVFRPEVRDFYNLEKMWQAPDLEEETLH
jgi:ribosome-associated protein